MRGLTDSEKNLWARATQNVRPLDKAPTGPVESLPRVSVPAPRDEGFDPVLDLHGLVLHDAFQRSKGHVQNAAMMGYKYVIIITGLSGQIHEEFPRWFADHPLVRSINSLRGGGAWEIWLKKRGT